MAGEYFNQIIKNWPSKILALLVAVAIFFVHRIDELDERVFVIPVTLKMVDNYAVVNQDITTARITVRGPRDQMADISRDDLKAIVDLSTQQVPGKARLPLQIYKDNMTLKSNRLTATIEPAFMSVETDYKIRRFIQVRPTFRGEPEAGYSIVKTAIKPSEIEVEGPKNRLETILSLPTEEIDVSGKKAGYVTEATIKNQPLVHFINMPQVSVVVDIGPSLTEKVFENQPVQFDELNKNLKLLDEKEPLVKVTLRGSLENISKFNDKKLRLSVNLSDIKEEGSYVLPISIENNNTIENIVIDPAEVSLTVVRGE